MYVLSVNINLIVILLSWKRELSHNSSKDSFHGRFYICICAELFELLQLLILLVDLFLENISLDDGMFRWSILNVIDGFFKYQSVF